VTTVMAKKANTKKKGAAKSLAADSPPHILPLPASRLLTTQANPYAKLINRFYEPLILLRKLGQVRGERTSAEQFSGSEKCIKRRFLRNLSYICDYKKGGGTTTAMALSDCPEKQIFWVASNEDASIKIAPFLEEFLGELESLSKIDANRQNLEQRRLERRCIEFASARVKEEFKLLNSVSNECIEFLKKLALSEGRFDDSSSYPHDGTLIQCRFRAS
jgi:hypothetical protein